MWEPFLIPDPATEGNAVLRAASLYLGVLELVHEDRSAPGAVKISDDMLMRVRTFHGLPLDSLPCSIPELLVGTETFTELTTTYSSTLGHLSARPLVTIGLCAECGKPEFLDSAAAGSKTRACTLTKGCPGVIVSAKKASPRPKQPRDSAKPEATSGKN